MIGINMVGRVYGDLLVIGEADSRIYGRSYKSMVFAECVCGDVSEYPATRLRRSRAIRCRACRYKHRGRNKKSFDQNYYEKSIVNRAKKKGIQVSLKFKDFKEMTKRDCEYCEAKPRNVFWISDDFYANGVDRMDPRGTYSKRNCVPCCPTCNFMKHGLEYSEFIKHIQKILWRSNELCI